MSGKKLTIYGYTTDDQDYSKNQVLLTNNLGADDTVNNDASGTLRTKADYLKVYNLNIANTRGQGDQAIALSAYGDYEGFYGCQLLGYQDTLLSNQGRQFYSKTYIEGRTDFVFGHYAVSWFDQCDIGLIGGSGWITANGRPSADDPSFYVFDGATVTDEGNVGAGKVYLGRPWREYSRVVFQNSYLSEVINSAGWSVWNDGDERTGNVFYGEYGNTGAGAQGPRANFARELDAPMQLSDLFDNTEWIDFAYNDGTEPPATTTVPAPTSTSTAPATSTTSSGGCKVSKWGQCGGNGYTGCMNCASGSTCTYQNDWYSQCL